MPTIGVEKNAFLNGIERKEGQVTQEDLENLFFDLGLELDDIEVEGEKGCSYLSPFSFIKTDRMTGKIITLSDNL